jgi:Holliday junction resolvase RusA-like endonuclease
MDPKNKAIEFTVLAHPGTQGSLRSFMAKGKIHLTSDNPNLKSFRQELGWEALRARAFAGIQDIFAGKHIPISITAEYYFAPPATMPRGRTLPAVKPDLDKLDRAVNDACTGILWVDDGQIVRHTTAKYYGLPERVHIIVEKIEQSIKAC